MKSKICSAATPTNSNEAAARHAFAQKLSRTARKLIEDRDNDIVFSAVSIWETAIKYALETPDFYVNSHLVRRGCLDNGMIELAMTSVHAIIVVTLPLIYNDPFDRLLVA